VRAFLAIPLPRRLTEDLAEMGQGVPGLRAQKPETLHLTIRFLGDIEDPEPVAAAAAEAALNHDAFELELKGTGVFPHAGRARIFWVGLGVGEREAGNLAKDVERLLRGAGFPAERRPWHGHVTLGRFKRPQRVDPGLLDPFRVFGRTQADELVLFQSTLTPEGALHESVRELSLGRGN
jgi:2'-5' RNA ligase